MATKSSEARAKVSLDSSNFERGSKAVIKAANAMSAAVTAAFAAAGVAIIAAFGLNSIKNITQSANEVFTFGEEMANAGVKAKIAAGRFYLLNNALEKGLSLETVSSMLGDNAEVLDRSASQFRDVSIKLWAVGEKIRGFWLGLMERVTPVLSRFLDGALARSLVDAGQQFGDAIAEASKAVYTLFENGQLWETFKAGFKIAFDYAGERLAWLGQFGYDLLSAMFAGAFSDGINQAYANLEDTISGFVKSQIENAKSIVLGVWGAIETQFNKLADKLESAFVWAGTLDPAEAERRKQQRYANMAQAQGQRVAYEMPQGATWVDRLVTIIARNQFKMSGELSEQIEAFRTVVKDSISQYDENAANDPARSFENKNRRGVTGADSLAVIGGGGGFFAGFAATADVQRSQLNELREINRKLTFRDEERSFLPVGRERSQPVTISRTERGSVFNGSY